jgi:hypothetical protein
MPVVVPDAEASWVKGLWEFVLIAGTLPWALGTTDMLKSYRHT